ncbi:MAG: hypothetical protein KAW84_07670, partial [Thermoplasmata archaeon]|nr:hypothetical protein [Thermoplasmata archaeon]
MTCIRSEVCFHIRYEDAAAFRMRLGHLPSCPRTSPPGGLASSRAQEIKSNPRTHKLEVVAASTRSQWRNSMTTNGFGALLIDYDNIYASLMNQYGYDK